MLPKHFLTKMPKTPSHLEREYIEMNNDLSLEIIKYITISLLLIMANEAFISILQNQILPVIFIIGVIICASFPLRAIWSKRRKYETGVTIFCVLVYMGGLVFNIVDDRYLRTPYGAFYMSYSYGIFERILAEGIAQIHHRVFFSILAMFLRFLTTPYNDVVAYITHIAMTSIAIFVAIYRDRRNKHFFYSHYNSNEQLSKFKDLVVQHIPEAIVIVSQDLTKSLFVNNSFLSQVDTTIHLHKQLAQFVIIEDIQTSDNGFNALPSPSGKTLLDVVRSSPDIEKHSYMVKSASGKRSGGRFGFEADKEHEVLSQARILSLTWEDEPSFAIIMHDITQHHTIMSLKIANTQKDKVLATVSHELRTPLNGMLGMIQIMEKKIKDAELLSFLAICKTSTNLLVSLVSSILDLNQIKAKKIKLNIEKIEIRELLRNITSLFEYQCLNKGVYLKVGVKPGTPPFLNTDKDRLSQVLINLVGNAHKFTSKGGILVSAGLDSNGSVRFSVEDTGIGIAEEDKSKLFQVFGKVDQENEKINSRGVGLGLTIAESLVQVLNDNCKPSSKAITVESKIGKGSIFSFTIQDRVDRKEKVLERKSITYQSDLDVTLPTVPNEEESFVSETDFFSSNRRSTVNTPVKTPSPARHSITSERITREPSHFKLMGSLVHSTTSCQMASKPWVLIVDDNLFNIAVAEHLVSSHGYRVRTALSGQGAIDLVSRNDFSLAPISLILMDCQMPIMDGYETTRILRKMMNMRSIPEIPIVALTANDSEADKENCRKSGMCDHLSKPLKDAELAKIFKIYCQ